MEELDNKAITELLHLGDLVTPLAIRTASSIGLFDQFNDGPTPASVIAGRLRTAVEPLQKLLNALVAAGVLSQESQGYAVTDVGGALRANHPLSMQDVFKVALTELRAWSQLEHCVRTGASGFERAYGETHRSYRARHPAEDVRMDRAHRAATRLELLTLTRAYPWGDQRWIVDVGGGTGMLLAGLLGRFPALQGTLFDLPRMVANAPPVLDDSGVSERCTIVGGDFFQEVPSGGDVYVLKAVVGGWDDDSCQRILINVRRAMRADSRLLIIEPVMGAGAAFSRGNIVQLQSFVLYGGKDRTVEEYQSLSAAAGLRICRIIHRSTLPIIELAIAETLVS